MPATYDLLLKGGTLVNHDGIGTRDVAIRDGRIAAIGNIPSESAGETVDTTGLTLIPGVIDSQVHFREPGMTHKEDLETGSRGAVLGGVTTVFEMPNTNPNTTTTERLAEKIDAAHHRMFCDFAFYVGGTEENVEQLPELERLPGAAGVKVFIGSSTGTLLVDKPDVLDRIIQKITRRAAFHCEDEARLNERKDLRVPGDPSSHPVWRDEEAALIATKQLVALAEKHKKRVHVLHISTGIEMEWLAGHKEWASVEVTPHHLTLVAPDCYQRLGTYCQMNPPVRDADNNARIWAGIANGVVDVLGSDHAPHTRDEKDEAYPKSHSGMTGVQTLLPIMLDHVSAGRLSLARLVDLTSHGPQRLFGLRNKGRIAVGYDADIAVVDLKRRHIIRNEDVASRAGWTPYDGKEVTGWPVGTFVRGRKVVWDGKILGQATGEVARFYEGA